MQMAEIPGDDVGWNRQASLQFHGPAEAVEIVVHEGGVIELHMGRPIARGTSKDPIKKQPCFLGATLLDEGGSFFQEALNG
jgi:hypothetical protein